MACITDCLLVALNKRPPLGGLFRLGFAQLGLFDEAGLKHDVAEIGFAIEFVVAVDDADALDLGANFHCA